MCSSIALRVGRQGSKHSKDCRVASPPLGQPDDNILSEVTRRLTAAAPADISTRLLMMSFLSLLREIFFRTSIVCGRGGKPESRSRRLTRESHKKYHSRIAGAAYFGRAAGTQFRAGNFSSTAPLKATSRSHDRIRPSGGIHYCLCESCDKLEKKERTRQNSSASRRHGRRRSSALHSRGPDRQS